jgi:hypothetical protein
MRRFRLVIATLVAVAMLAIGAAACSTNPQPGDSTPGEVLTGVAEYIVLSLYFSIETALCANGCGI